MSHSELDKPTPVEAYPPIHDFSGLKKLLKSRGYHIPEAVPYKPPDFVIASPKNPHQRV